MSHSPVTEPSPDRIDLRPMLAACWRERSRTIATVLIAAILMYAATFLIPKTFRATIVILPPEESDLLSNMSLAQRALSKFPRFGILDDYFTPADTYKAILLSRSVQTQLAEEFHLMTLYHRPSMEKTLKVLKDRYKVKLNPDGTIAVQFDDGDPKRAATMANRTIALLDRFNLEKRNTTARSTRIFLERRVSETNALLQQDELALRLYQEKHHAISPATSGGDLRAAADLMARKFALDVRLGVLRSYLRDDNEQVQQAQVELDELSKQVAALPQLQNDLVRLTRDAKVQEQLYLLLTAELEQARVRETMDTPTVQVLDAAVPPERHEKPKRLLLTAAAACVALLVQLGWVVASEAGARRRAGA